MLAGAEALGRATKARQVECQKKLATHNEGTEGGEGGLVGIFRCHEAYIPRAVLPGINS